MRYLLLLVFIAAVAWPPSASAQVVHYTIQDLGTGDFTRGAFGSKWLAINASGQVTGTYFVPNGGAPTQHAFRTTASGGVNDPGADLGILPGGRQSFGTGINASGQVAGTSSTGGDNFYYPFRTTGTGNLTDPGANLGVPGWGTAINGNGQVTGRGQSNAFRSSPNGQPPSLTDLGTLPGYASSAGNAINDAGQVSGYAINGSVHRAFRTTALGTLTDPGADLGMFLGATTSEGNAINASGQVTGISDVTFFQQHYQHAFRTTATGLISDPGTDLTPGFHENSYGFGINNLGVVVGSDGGNSLFAFVYDTQLRDLTSLLVNGPGWVLTVAYDINDAGQIAGFGTFGGQTHAFRLTPVPEPSALVLLGVAAVSGTLARRRQKRSARRSPSPS
jgi:uncharacterized membrane protein